MVLSSISVRPLYSYRQFDQLLWTCNSTVYNWSSETRIVAHAYNTALMVPLTVRICNQIPDRQCITIIIIIIIIIIINTNIANIHNVQYCSVASQSVTWSPMDQHFLIPRAMFTKRSKRWSLFTCENRTRCSLRVVCLVVLPICCSH